MQTTGVQDHVLVVGGAQGLGRTVVRLLAEGGGVVSVLDRLPPEPAADRPTVAYEVVDILDAARVEQALTQLCERRGPVRHAMFFQRFRGADDGWQGELETSLGATRRIVEWLSSRFPDDGASILLVSSAAGRFVAEEQPAGYHAAKAATEQLARYWAVALGPRGVRCNCVAPAIFRKEGFPADSPRDRALAQVIPLRRVPTAEEIGRVILFLCSAEAACVTGQTVVTDGGLSLLAQATLVQRLVAPR